MFFVQLYIIQNIFLDMQNVSDAISEEALTEMQHAYVPYLYARDRIARVTDDMKNMKTRHIVLVNGIETNYRDIERETQVGWHS